MNNNTREVDKQETIKCLSKGAEAVISLEDNKIIKNRIKKSYRISSLDEKLRKSRTKSEAKIIEKLKDIVPVPKIIQTDNKEQIIMEHIEGKKLSEHLEKLNWKNLCIQIAENISKMHNQNIIHSDLTTSNMIFNPKNNLLYFIDFGLAFHSQRIEDKAVDLHLLKQALDAKHFSIAEKAFEIILKNYNTNQSKEIIQRIKTIESRGRYKDKH
ncbi:MAG: KEOPS complex kinase/ATPase Bud32 [Candidatus Pacearchaeota archaeon]